MVLVEEMELKNEPMEMPKRLDPAVMRTPIEDQQPVHMNILLTSLTIPAGPVAIPLLHRNHRWLH